MIYIISGISRGLGKAITEALLERGERVIGLGRTCSTTHPNLTFVPCDLSKNQDLDHLLPVSFSEPVTLINNAGILGEIKRMADHEALNNFREVLEVNTFAALQLTLAVYAKLERKEDFTLVNISSGAATKAIPSWGAYCTSKAALNMWSEVFYAESIEKGIGIKVYAIAPGVVDTEMQTKIRAADPNDFSSLEKFQSLNDNRELTTPEVAAKQLLRLLELPYSGKIRYDLRSVIDTSE